MENIEKIEIPEEPQQKPVDAAKAMAELMKLSITEEKMMIPMEHFKHIAVLETDSVIYIIRKIQDFAEITQNQWNFIPFDIPKEIQNEHNRKKMAIHFFCIDNAKSLKKYTKTIRKYFPLGKVEWIPFDSKEYKQIIKK